MCIKPNEFKDKFRKFINKNVEKLRNLKKDTKKFIIILAITVFFTIGIIIVGFVLEGGQYIDGLRLSKFMERCFYQHHDRFEIVTNAGETIKFVKKDIYESGYKLFYAILHSVTIIYSSVAIIISTTTKKLPWCAYVILISVIFLVFMNSYLTLMLQYDDDSNTTIYSTYMTLYTSVATILSGIAGLKITFVLNKNDKDEKPATETKAVDSSSEETK